jgi:hypothetical protein
MSPGGPTAAGGLRCNAAEFGESGFVWDALGVVTGGDQKLPRELDTDSEEFDQLWCPGRLVLRSAD